MLQSYPIRVEVKYGVIEIGKFAYYVNA